MKLFKVNIKLSTVFPQLGFQISSLIGSDYTHHQEQFVLMMLQMGQGKILTSDNHGCQHL